MLCIADDSGQQLGIFRQQGNLVDRHDQGHHQAGIQAGGPVGTGCRTGQQQPVCKQGKKACSAEFEVCQGPRFTEKNRELITKNIYDYRSEGRGEECDDQSPRCLYALGRNEKGNLCEERNKNTPSGQAVDFFMERQAVMFLDIPVELVRNLYDIMVRIRKRGLEANTLPILKEIVDQLILKGFQIAGRSPAD